MNHILTRINLLFNGILNPVIAIRIITRHPKMLLLGALPVLITLVLYASVFVQLQGYIHSGVHYSLTRLGITSESWLASALVFLTEILILFMSAATFSFAASIASCPVNDFLAEETEKHITPPIFSNRSPSIWGRVKLISIDLSKTFFAAVAAVLALVLSFIPVLNVISMISTFLLISFQFVSYPQTRRGQTVKDGFRFVIIENFWESLGFGMIYSALFAIPVVSAFCLPLAVVGGTVMFGRQFTSKSLANKN